MLRYLTIAALAALLGFAVIASGLDRMSGAGEGTANAVPGPFRVNALEADADSLIEAGDAAGAARLSRQAIARNPMDAPLLGVYGQALLMEGEDRDAARTFAVSRRLGWREPMTDLYWIDADQRRGDIDGAADRLDALLRQTPTMPQRSALLARMEGTAAGRTALAARLARAPDWRTTYFADTALPTAGDPVTRGEVASRLATREGVRDCALVSPLLGALLRFGHADQAQALYRLHCAAPGEPLVPADGRFVRANLGAPPTGLDWRFTGEGAVSLSIEPRPGIAGRVVVVGNLAPVPMAFAFESLTLGAGAYRVSWRAIDDAGTPSPAIDAALGCGPDDRPWAAKRLIDPRTGRFAADVTIPGQCAEPTLSFAIAPSVNGIVLGEVMIDRR